jgi:hypothetical protein
MSSFATPLQLAQYMNGDPALTEDDLDDDFVVQATILLEMISADIEMAAGVPIDAGTGTRLLPGVWGRDLLLPNGPIRDVTAVTVNGVALEASGYEWNDRHLIRRGVGVLEENIDNDFPDHTQGAMNRAGNSWQGPFATVRISYSWGFDDIPSFLTSLALRIAARAIGNTGDVRQESLAVYSVTYASGGADGSHVRDKERRQLRRVLNVNGGTITVGGR